MAQLHKELIVEILLRLPVKSLLRFKCVSSSLCRVIETPNFINSHNLICPSQKLIFKHNWRNEFQVCDLNVDSEVDIIHIGNPVPSILDRVSGYCKGLLLLSIPRSRFIFTLWNPSTRQFRNLPTCPIDSHLRDKITTIGLGLGYDDSMDDYKVSCIVRVREAKLEFQVWIYGLKSNIWRRAALDYTYADYTMEDCSAYGKPGIGSFVDGNLHWLIHDEKSKSEIVAFDMRKETFSLIPRPDCLHGFSAKLDVLEGCLCISFSVQDNRYDYFYVGKKDGSVDKFSWTKLFWVKRIGTYGTILPWNVSFYGYQKVKPLGYSKSGDNILLHLSPHVMVWYNLEKKCFGKFQIDTDIQNWNIPISCVESVVSITA